MPCPTRPNLGELYQPKTTFPDGWVAADVAATLCRRSLGTLYTLSCGWRLSICRSPSDKRRVYYWLPELADLFDLRVDALHGVPYLTTAQLTDGNDALQRTSLDVGHMVALHNVVENDHEVEEATLFAG